MEFWLARPIRFTQSLFVFEASFRVELRSSALALPGLGDHKTSEP